MSNLKNTLFIQFATIMFIIIAIFEGALLFLISSFNDNANKEDELLICNYKIASNNKATKNISLSIALFIYLITLLIGYKFIDKIVSHLEESIKRLKIFNSNVSHELKTPLTIMKGEIEVALMNDECNKKVLKSLLSEINYINEITDKLLFLIKKDALNKNNFEDIDLEDVVLEMFEKYSKKIKIDLNIKEDEYIIKGDKTLLKIAISNIIENSIKYKATKLDINLTKEKSKTILIIKDNGIGIPKEKLPFVFDEFYRVDESKNKKIKGFGLGLSIVKSIINLHNGDVKLKSNKGVEVIIFV